MQINERRAGTIGVNYKTFTIGMIIFYCSMFPADKLNIKEVLLVIAIICNFPDISNFLKSDKGNTKLFFYGMAFPAILCVYALIRGVPLSSTLSFGYVWIYLLLIPGIVSNNMNAFRPFASATIIIALIIDFIYLCDVFGVISIFNNPLIKFFSNMNEVQYGKGIFSTFGYSIFFKSSPLLLITYAYMIKNKKYIICLIIFLAFMASGTRGNLFMGLFLTVTVPLVESKGSSKRAGVIITLFGASCAFAPSLIVRITKLNNLKNSRSDIIRYKAIESIIEILRNSPINLLFGTGVGSSFYFSGRDLMTSVVEVSYFDYLRQVGIIGMVIFACFILMPIKRYIYNDKWILLGYFAYLLTAFTNPLLVTSTAFMVYVLIYSGALLEYRESLL